MSIISNFPISSGTGSGLAIYGPLNTQSADMYEKIIFTPVIPKIAILYGTSEIVVAIMNDFNDNNSGYTCYTHQGTTRDCKQLGCYYTNNYQGSGSALFIDYWGSGVTQYGANVAYVVG